MIVSVAGGLLNRIVLVAFVTGAFALMLGTAATRASAAPAVVTHELGGQAKAESYWTPERMREATPLDGPPPVSGGTSSATAVAASIPPDQEIPNALDLTYPYRIHGRLFLRIGPDDASCSATVVTSFSRDLILTAGHCVVEPTTAGPLWATNIVFVPAYRDGAAPFGAYPGVRSGSTGIWAFEGDISFDLGAVNLAPGASGLIQDALGSRGVAFNRNPKKYKGKVFELYGYPAKPEPDYNGERPILCTAPFIGLEAFTGAVVINPCHQQEGSSGGGWVLPGGIVNSVTSHAGCPVTTGCATISGTYFGDLEFNLWRQSAGTMPKGRQKRLKKCKKIRRRGKQLNCLSRAETFSPVIP
jgi:hypothetical protein